MGQDYTFIYLLSESLFVPPTSITSNQSVWFSHRGSANVSFVALLPKTPQLPEGVIAKSSKSGPQFTQINYN